MGRAYRVHGIDEKYIHFGQKAWREEPCGRPKCRWENNFRIHHVEIGWEYVN
jgi:hypothetical protein